jgi:hypothetical protein
VSTATAPAPVEVDPAVIAHLDFGIPCTIRDCEAKADWWLVCRRCNDHTPLCDEHRRADVAEAETHRPGVFLACGHCGRTVPARQWPALFEWLPIEPA